MDWISVKDRYPPKHCKGVLVLVNGAVHAAYFPDGLFSEGVVGGWEGCHYCGGESRVSFVDDSIKTTKIITHWMPLPEPPKEPEW